MADNSLQEVVFQFGGKTYRIRPTWKVLVRIESALGQSSRTLGMKCWATGIPASERGANPEISLAEISGVLAGMLADIKGAPPMDQIGEILVDEGYADLLLPLGSFLVRAQRGNIAHEQEILATRKAAEEAAAKAEEGAAQVESDPPKPPGEQAA